jgi:hypothetical protein
MKLRMKGNSLRLRVSPSEMSHLLDTGRIEETIHFAPDHNARLTYALEHHAEAKSVSVRYRPQEVTVIVSSEGVRQWASGPDVGLYGETATSDGALELAIEKDFACLDKSNVENADTFPNPNQGAVC